MFDLDKIALFDNMLWLNHVNVVLFYVKVVPKVVGAGLSKMEEGVEEGMLSALKLKVHF